MSQNHREADVKASKHPTKVHPGYNITKDENGEKDLSGQLQKVNVTTKHANGPEKMIKSERDHSPAMDAAIPVIGE
jgi:hypothetical protein